MAGVWQCVAVCGSVRLVCGSVWRCGHEIILVIHIKLFLTDENVQLMIKLIVPKRYSITSRLTYVIKSIYFKF